MQQFYSLAGIYAEGFDKFYFTYKNSDIKFPVV